MWAVDCKGAELVRSLRLTEEKVLGRRYALYILALVTEIDDEAIKWLTEYGRAIDSLTGDAIAFIVFYNSARFYATSNAYKHDSLINTEGTNLVLSRGLPVIDLPPKALNGSQGLSGYIRGNIWFPDEAFVTSMTYESDNIARLLGIKPTELPCLVLIDNPKSTKYYLLPMPGLGKELMLKLRQFIGEFYGEAAHKNYLALLEHCDKLQRKLYNLRRAAPTIEEEIARRIRDDPHNPLNLFTLFIDIDPISCCKGLVAWLSRVYRVRAGKNERVVRVVMPSELQREVQRLSGWIGYVSRLRHSVTKFEYFLKALEQGDISHLTLEQMEKFYSRKLRGVVPGAHQNWSKLTIVDQREIFKRAISRSNPTVTELEKRLNPLQEVVKDLYSSDSQRWQRTAREYRRVLPLQKALLPIMQIEEEIALIEVKFSEIERPKVSPILTRQKWGERRDVIVSKTGKVLQKLEDSTDTIFKVLELGMKLTGLP